MIRKHKLGDEGKGVSHAQWLLHNNRYGHFLKPRQVDGHYGVVTAAAVREAKHFLGYQKERTNAVYGPKLDAYLRGDRKLDRKMRRRRRMRLARNAFRTKTSKMLAVAQRNLGYVEGAGNTNKFGQWYGMDHQPWCAMFVSYCATQAGLHFHYSYCPTVVADARARRNGLRVTTSRRGAVVLFDWQGDGVADHIGLVLKGGANPTTIEGNTSPSDFSNGGMVKTNIRSASQIICYVRIGG